MALRSEVARTDNSKLGRAVLNDRTKQAKSQQAGNSAVAKIEPVVKEKKTEKKEAVKKTVAKKKFKVEEK